MKTKLSISLPKEMVAWLKKVAADNHASVSETLKVLLIESIKKRHAK